MYFPDFIFRRSSRLSPLSRSNRTLPVRNTSIKCARSAGFQLYIDYCGTEFSSRGHRLGRHWQLRKTLQLSGFASCKKPFQKLQAELRSIASVIIGIKGCLFSLDFWDWPLYQEVGDNKNDLAQRLEQQRLLTVATKGGQIVCRFLALWFRVILGEIIKGKPMYITDYKVECIA